MFVCWRKFISFIIRLANLRSKRLNPSPIAVSSVSRLAKRCIVSKSRNRRCLHRLNPSEFICLLERLPHSPITCLLKRRVAWRTLS